MSIRSDLTITQGEDVLLRLQVPPYQAPVTSWTLAGSVALYTNGVVGAVQFTAACAVQDGPGGVLTVTWSRAQTSGLAAGTYWWDVRRTNNGKNAVLACGQLTVLAPATP